MTLPEILDIILQYIKVLAWPIVVLILVLVYKRPIIGVLARLRKASGPGVALELDARELAEDAQEIAAVEATHVIVTPPAEPDNTLGTADATPKADSPATGTSPASVQELRARHPEHDLRYDTAWGTLRPRSANAAIVLSAWSDVVDDATPVARALRLPDGSWSIPHLATVLTQRGYISSSYPTIARRLQSLRNAVAASHEPPTEDAVVDFLSTSLLIREKLQSALKQIRLDQLLLTPDQSETHATDNDPTGSSPQPEGT